MIKRHNTETIFGIDVFRGLAIILMFITHGERLYDNTYDYGWLNNSLNFFALIEPFTSAVFLFLVGVGVFLSYANTKLDYSQWFKNNLQKSWQLYLIGILFFFMEYGLQVPEMFLGPSILSVIAIAIIVLSLCVTSSIFMALGSILILSVSWACEGVAVTGINTGPGGAFPLILFSLLGYLSYQSLKNKSKLIWGLIGLSIISWFYPHSPHEHWTTVYPSIYNHFTGGQTGIEYLQSFGQVDGYSKTGFWNHSVVSVFRIMLPLILCLWGATKFSSALAKYKISQGLALLGKHALGLYVLHLMILAALDALKIYPTSALIDYGLIIILIGLGLIYSSYQEKLTLRKAKGA